MEIVAAAREVPERLNVPRTSTGSGRSLLLIENGRVTGVVYSDGSGAEHTVHADADVIVSSGALVSPKLLMLSGIGPAEALAGHGISCVADLPGDAR